MSEQGKTDQEVLRFSRELLSMYFEKRDMNTLKGYIEDCTSWIGTGEGELCRNSFEAAAALENELLEYGDCFKVVNTDFYVTPLSTGGSIVYGTLRAIPHDGELSEENIRLSAVPEQTGKGLKLLHIHFSHADMEQEPGHFFVRQAAKTDNISLRAELNMRERQLANLTKNIPGGAHQCANDVHMTLLSMSDGFLEMFGYTREEIAALFEGRFINMVYPADRAEMQKSICSQLEQGAFLELEYRVQHKSGRPIWVLDKGRLIDDGTGGKCFCCLLIDITERKRQQEELRLSLERHQVILDQATDIIFEGDSVLSDVAAALKGNVRSSDLVGRIGGDEFLVYLPEVSEKTR